MRTLDDLLARDARTTTVLPAIARPVPTGGTPYGRAALASECAKVASTPPGGRDAALNDAAISMGGLIAGGHLELETVQTELTAAGLASGQSPAEVARALRLDATGGLTVGMATPRGPDDLETYERPDLTPWKPPIVAGQNGAGEQHDDPLGRSSWARRDLTEILDGTHLQEVAALMPRGDGVCLLYRGRVHSMHGEPESGKSFVIQAEAARVLRDGGTVAYLDFESDDATVVGRLRAMRVEDVAIRDRFDYRRPEQDPHDVLARIDWNDFLAGSYDLVVLDGVTEAFSVSAVQSRDNDELTGWIRRVARTIAQRTGAAVVLIDHVTKDSDSRGRYAIGGQAKLAALDGAAYVVDVVQPLGRGMRGVVSLRIAKDRPGAVRPYAGAWRKSDRTQEAARVVVESTPDGSATTVEVLAPENSAGQQDASGPWRPTTLMERLSRELEGHSDPLSSSRLGKLCSGKREQKLSALELLVSEGFVSRVDGPRGAYLHRSVRAYRQSADPLSDRFQDREPVEGWEGGHD